MKLTISFFLALLLAQGLLAQKEYSNDVLVLHNGKVLTGRVYAHPNFDSVLMLGIGQRAPESIAKLDVTRSIAERVFWKPYSPNSNWTIALLNHSKTEATKVYLRQSFLMPNDKEYRGEVISEAKNEITLKSSYTERNIMIYRNSFKKRRHEVVFQASITLDTLPDKPREKVIALNYEILPERPIMPSKGFLGVHFGVAFPTGSFGEIAYNTQFSNGNSKNNIGNARVGTELSINGIFLFQPGSQLGVGLIGQFNRNSVRDNIGQIAAQKLSYETNLLAMGLAVALPLHPDKISFLDIRCMGGVAAFSTSSNVKSGFSQSREAVIAYEQGYGPAFVADAGLRFMLHKRIELGFRLGHSVAIIDNIQSINVNGASNSPMDFQKLNKVNSSNITFSLGLGIGL